MQGGRKHTVRGSAKCSLNALSPQPFTNYLPGVHKGPVVFLGLAVALSLLGDVTLYVVLPVYHEALGLGPIQVGVLLSANRWVRLLTNDWARRIIDRRRPEHVFAAVLATGAGATALYASSPIFVVFLAARLVWGASWSFIRHLGVMTVLSVVSTHETAAERNSQTPGHTGGVLGLYNAVVQVGFIGGTITGGLLFDRFGFSPAFAVMAAVSLSAIYFDYAGFALLRSGRARASGTATASGTPTAASPGAGAAASPDAVAAARGTPAASTPAAANPASPANSANTGQRSRHTRRASYVLLFRGFVATCVGTGLIVSTLGFALQSRFGSEIQVGTVMIGVTTVTALAIAAHYLVQTLGSPPLGMLVDKLGFHRAETYAFTLGAFALAGAAWFPAYRFLLPAVAVFFVVTVMGKLALVARAGLGGSVSFSRFMTAADLGAAVGPLVGWLTISRVGSADAVFMFGAALYLLAAVVGGRSTNR